MLNFFHPKNQVGGSGNFDSVGVEDTKAGLVVNMRPQLAVNIMKVEFLQSQHLQLVKKVLRNTQNFILNQVIKWLIILKIS